MDIISIEQATIEEKQRKQLDDVDSRLTKQEKLSWQIVFGVGIAFIFTVGLVAVEIIIFHTNENKIQNNYFQELQSLREKIFQTEFQFQKEINDFKILNHLK